VRDSEWGEVVAALLEPEPGAARATDRELAAFCAARLAGFRRPRRIAWIDALPETETGKIDRQAAARVETRPLAARD
jgi:acyl-CoA synthetase (AMP-forming)/AMP-acid ligase II